MNEDTIGSICMKDEVSPGFTCACKTCELLAPPPKLSVGNSFSLFLADFKAKENS